ncbi:patatin-like phospholipase family protein [Hahella aquimaris]|uniref:patatin-like phospholipase family protein n=1 Tax=Hahella sp. HNIBRBA332 TaxID=3015983 RepID=UPI00273B9FCC|nr:patatin-like phospholipase family protein [Hahella sp. HNIBRBA332]WLQ11760.1 patatin-like phospholipase family protein [Hahella sp. HNIBRBA332]
MQSISQRHEYSECVSELKRWFPQDRSISQENPVPPHTFEFALALAGAVSGGAYAAGFMDVLFEVMDAWEAARGLAGVPVHHVRLKTVSGASAGAMNGALAALFARRSFKHGRHPREESGYLFNNPFYQVWVRDIDAQRLLRPDDLGKGSALRSLLNSAHLDQVAESLLRRLDATAESSDGFQRPWMGDAFSLHFTVSNLRGVPYVFAFAAPKGEGPGARDLTGHLSRLHQDHLSFAVPVSGVVQALDFPPDHRAMPLDFLNESWRGLIQGALAAGAFPVALQARTLRRPRSDYDWRFIRCDDEGVYRFVTPAWGQEEEQDESYCFLNVDGGVMNNEPFQLARRTLSGLDGRNPRSGVAANRAVIMLDPFPEAPAPGLADQGSLAHILVGLLSGLKNQTRFDCQDIRLADSGDIYSRFLVAPRRPGKKGRLDIAAGGLQGFLGFFAESYRHHDFFLGRLNGYKFLRDWFVLPAANPIIQHGYASLSDAGRERFASRVRRDHYQIAPLMAGVSEHFEGDATESPMPRWPGALSRAELTLAEGWIRDRLDVVWPQVLEEVRGVSSGWRGRLLRLGVGLCERPVKAKLLDKVMQELRGAMREMSEG